MTGSNRPLVVGAGPAGLAAALFLARQGQPPRIIEMRQSPSGWSKALAVSPRTLDILEPTGLTQRMLELGLPIRGVRFYQQGRGVAALSFDGMHPEYPFMLGLSQAITERLLTESLEAAGGRVERGVKMVECGTGAGGAEATIEPTGGGPREVVRCPWLLAADGAHSVARGRLEIDFVGSTFAHEWHLADAPLRTMLAADMAHVFFLAQGAFLFMIRVIDDNKDREGDHIWRVIGNRPEPLSQLVDAEPAGTPLWTSSFHISHRINATLAAGHVYFAGDAAHVHSPVGARGMNLGLEDAWVFAELVRAGRLHEYDRLRKPVDEKVVRRVEFLSRIASGESAVDRFARRWLFPVATKVPVVRKRMLETVSGLDHPLPDLSAVGTQGSQRDRGGGKVRGFKRQWQSG